MKIYVIIYHIINNKNYNIDMSIKYNTILRGRKEKRKEYMTITVYSYIENIS